MNDETTVTITIERYKELLVAESKLQCLEACGVDNWDGYDESMQLFWNREK